MKRPASLFYVLTEAVRGDSKKLVSSAHPVSNLRLVRVIPSGDETPAELEYRVKRSALQDWNHNYWKGHNRDFFKEKENYIKSQLCKSNKRRVEVAGDGKGAPTMVTTQSAVTYDELSYFYKKFLDENHKKHVNYSREWYMRHIQLLLPAFRALVASTMRKCRNVVASRQTIKNK